VLTRKPSTTWSTPQVPCQTPLDAHTPRACYSVLCYGNERSEAIAKVQALALRVIAERLEHGEAPGDLLDVSFRAA